MPGPAARAVGTTETARTPAATALRVLVSAAEVHMATSTGRAERRWCSTAEYAPSGWTRPGFPEGPRQGRPHVRPRARPHIEGPTRLTRLRA
ncbi:hypothetical protein GCM10027194_27780 [Thalassiella azotivora]